jgi:hypothetical protein
MAGLRAAAPSDIAVRTDQHSTDLVKIIGRHQLAVVDRQRLETERIYTNLGLNASAKSLLKGAARIGAR